jgi:hypothetical protein
MRRSVVRQLVVGGAAAAAVALVAGPASASTTVTITGANAAFSASSGAVFFSDLTTGQTMRCAGSTLSGSLADVTNAALPFTTTRSNGTAHSITGLGFTGCTLAQGSVTSSVPGADLPDDLEITATSTTAPQAGGFVSTAGTSGLLAHFSVGTCSFDVAGQAAATWTNGTSDQLNFTGAGTLTPANSSVGCLLQFQDGDVLEYLATYTVTPNSIDVTP